VLILDLIKMTKKFGVLGYPIAHSLSPAMLDAAFAEKNVAASFEKFEIPPEKLGEFVEKVRAEKIAGLSVTIPYKIEIQKYLDEIEDSAKKIGAVNTVFWRGEKLCGTNTDWFGFLETLEKKIDSRGKSAVILGAGGAAHAIVHALLEKNCAITVIVRGKWEFADLEKKFARRGLQFDFIQNLDKYSPEILVNTTPLGMAGKFVGMSFVPVEFFAEKKPLVFDIVYTPSETKLLADARAAGCATIAGLGMLVRQGAKQFEIWLGEKPNLATMWSTAGSELEK